MTAPMIVDRPDIADSCDQDTPWNLFLWNDPVTLMGQVKRILQKIFGYPEEKASQLMLEAHMRGKTVVWSGGREQAESYALELHGHGLQATVGRDR